VFGIKATEVEGTKVSPVATLTGEGIIKCGVEKSAKFLGLSQDTTSGEAGVSKLSPSKSRLGEEKIAGKLPKSNALETPTKDIIGV